MRKKHLARLGASLLAAMLTMSMASSMASAAQVYPAALAAQLTPAAQYAANAAATRAEAGGIPALRALLLSTAQPASGFNAVAFLERRTLERLYSTTTSTTTVGTTSTATSATASPALTPGSYVFGPGAGCGPLNGNYVAHRDTEWLLGIKEGWIEKRHYEWCGNGSAITYAALSGFNHNQWFGFGQCENNAYNYVGWISNPDWAHGIYTANIGDSTPWGCMNYDSLQATMRIAGNGYEDGLY